MPPVAVIKKSHQGQGLVNSVAGALTGMVEGEKVNEEKRKWDEQMEFAYQQLAVQVEEGRLDRTQRDRFTAIQDRREREMQITDITATDARQTKQQDFQERVLRDIEQPFAREQAEQDRSVQRRGQDKSYSASTYATRKGFEAQMTALADDDAKIKSRLGTAVNVVSGVLAGADWATMAPEQQAAARDMMVQEYLGLSRTNGAEGVVQRSPQEVAAAQALFTKIASDLPSAKAELYDHESSLAAASSMTKAGFDKVVSGTYATEGAVVFVPPSTDRKWDPYTYGGPEMDTGNMTVAQGNVHREAMMLIAEAVDDAQLFPDQQTRYTQVIAQDYGPRLAQLMAKGKFNAAYVEQYEEYLQNGVMGIDPMSGNVGESYVDIPEEDTANVNSVAGPR